MHATMVMGAAHTARDGSLAPDQAADFGDGASGGSSEEIVVASQGEHPGEVDFGEPLLDNGCGGDAAPPGPRAPSPASSAPRAVSKRKRSEGQIAPLRLLLILNNKPNGLGCGVPSSQ